MTLRQCRIDSQYYYVLQQGNVTNLLNFLIWNAWKCLMIGQSCLFLINWKLQPDHHLPPLELKAYKDAELCVVSHLRQYNKLTENLRKGDYKQLLLSYVKPHKPVPTTTLSRWCVHIMKESGVNVDIFGSHSTRTASTSKCEAAGLPFKDM